MLSRAEALLVCACGRERQHPSCPCNPGFTGAVGGSWGAQSSLFSVPAISPGHLVLPPGWFMAVQSHPMFCALCKKTLTGRVWSSFTFSSRPIYQPGHFQPHTLKSLWMKALLSCRLQCVHGILRLSQVPPILFGISLKFVKEWVLTQ